MTDISGPERRAAAIDALGLLDSGLDTRFDRVLVMAAEFFGLPFGGIMLAGADRLIPKAVMGFEVESLSLGGSLTESVMRSHSTVMLEDASLDPRYADGAIVTGPPFVRAFIGHPLRSGNEVIGAFALGGPQPRSFDEADRVRFRLISAWIEEELGRESELGRAAEVQRALLPRSLPHLDGYQIVASSTPARSVGGDFFDVYETTAGIGVTVADVMGKGMGAAILAATVRAVMRTVTQDFGVAGTVTRTAQVLEDDLTGAGSFATLFHGRLRGHDGRIDYVDAGHGLTLLIRADGAYLRLAHDDLPLGLAFEYTWHQHTVTLDPGDTLLSFSDGVLDLFDGTADSLEDVVDLVRYGDSLASTIDFIRSMAERDRNTDDVAIVGIKRMNP